MTMHRLAVLLLLCTGVVAIAAFAWNTAAPGPAQAGAQRPNVVVLMTDHEAASDMTVMARTRRLLGARGVTFADSYVSSG
jgi:hypothetical protein